MAAVCEHGADCHTGLEPSMASAPEASRAWLLIEHPGPWPHEAADAAQPAPLAELVKSAEEFGVRVQLIRRPGRRQVGDARAVFLGWTAGAAPFLRYAEVSASAPGLSERFSVRAVPTLMVLKGGQVVARQAGAAPAATLRAWVEGALS